MHGTMDVFNCRCAHTNMYAVTDDCIALRLLQRSHCLFWGFGKTYTVGHNSPPGKVVGNVISFMNMQVLNFISYVQIFQMGVKRVFLCLLLFRWCGIVSKMQNDCQFYFWGKWFSPKSRKVTECLMMSSLTTTMNCMCHFFLCPPVSRFL